MIITFKIQQKMIKKVKRKKEMWGKQGFFLNFGYYKKK